MLVHVNDANFQEVVNAHPVVVVDFWAEWCGPCRMIAPIIDQLAVKYEGKVVFAKCDVDDASEMPTKYSIRNIPTLLFLKNGELVDKMVGATTEKAISEKIDALL